MRKWLYTQRPGHERGQSLIEITLFLPIILLLLVGLIEIGVFVNSYITSLDSSRAAARYVSPLDPFVTRCWADFSSPTTGKSISAFSSSECADSEYRDKATNEVRTWGAEVVYDTCKDSKTQNFFYVAGFLALLNMPRGGLDPNPHGTWPGDDILVSTVPISAGVILDSWNFGGKTYNGRHTWTLYGVQPTPDFSSFVDSTFTTILGTYKDAPATGLVVVEVFHAHPQFTKLFSTAARMVGGSSLLPDPIPIHTYSVFPVPAVEPK